jgi:hypothetical protein
MGGAKLVFVCARPFHVDATACSASVYDTNILQPRRLYCVMLHYTVSHPPPEQ